MRVGDAVKVRGRRWTVTEVRTHEACQTIELAGDALQIPRRRFLSPFDMFEHVDASPAPRLVSLRRWREICRKAVARDGSWAALKSAARARIDLFPYQLEPAIALVRGLGTRILLADDVGLGKTVQAALAITELRDRGAASRFLIVSPAGLREQWSDLLQHRFNLDSTIVDVAAIRRLGVQLPHRANVWAHIPVAIASIDFIKRPEILPDVASCAWDVVVVDEAHHLSDGSDRGSALHLLCKQSPYVLLLTATPHNGDPVRFRSLCALGAQSGGRILAFRRSRRDVGFAQDRRICRMEVRPSKAERRLHLLLASLARNIASRSDRSPHAALIVELLRKRAFSSAYALEQSARRRLAWIASAEPDVEQMALPLCDAGEFDVRDDSPLVRLPMLADAGHERRLMEELVAAAAEVVQDKVESKVRRIDRLLTRLRRLNEPAIVFTEYRDTLLHLRDAIGGPCVVLHGGLTRIERRNGLEAFVNGRVPILLATDAAGEGLNLHHTCRVVINLELPWNPVRLEQRIGRVDRIGQRRRVHVVNLVARGTGEMRILERITARVRLADTEVGAQDPTGGSNRKTVDAQRVEALQQQRDAAGYGATGDAPAEFVRIMESEAEAARLALLRRVLCATPGPGTMAHPGYLSIAPSNASCSYSKVRRARWLRLLGRRALVLVETLFESDERRLASHLTPLLVPARAIPDVRAVELLTSTCSESVLARLDPTLDDWLKRSQHDHAMFWGVRVDREKANARSRTSAGAELFQPGLFDLRDHRSRILAAESDAERLAALSTRIRDAETASRTAHTTTRAILILLPHSPL
ncbi:MAG TPA: helicase-related protein [Vicinamibacterales bacterium]|nr:helicase-related protein [Vicinamibacterales bacterium]